MVKRILQLISITLLFLPFLLGAYVSPGSPTGHVNDFAGMLNTEERQQLETSLTNYQQQSGHEIAVVTIPTHGTDETIETYAEKLFQEWGIGKAAQDNGALLLIARDDRNLRIEVGYGLEPELTDIESGRIIRDIITPSFQQGNFSQGIINGVKGMTDAISVESFVPESQQNQMQNFSGFPAQLLFLPFFFIMWFGSMLARSKSWWAGGVVGGILGLIFKGFGFGLFGIGGLVFIGLILDFIVSKGYNASRRNHVRPPWWTGGGMGGFGGGIRGRGGGGFGGFGGGGSGGGGASGRW